MYRFNRIAGPIFLMSLLAIQATSARANDADTETKTWPEDVYQSIVHNYDEAKEEAQNLEVRFVNFLFYNTLEMKLFSIPLNKDNSLGLTIKRDIYNNYDVINSFTIIDRIRLDLNSHLYGLGSDSDNYSAPTVMAFPFAGVNLGAGASIEVRDISQLEPADFAKLPGVQTKKASILAKMQEQKAQAVAGATPTPTPPQDGDIEDINPYINSFNLDSSIKVRLHKVFNPFTLPFRLPLSRTDMRYMKDGETMSYDLSGQVGFGGSVGFNVVPTAGMTIGADFTLETHIQGEFEVSIQRQDARHARVRISKVRAQGESAKIAIGADWDNFFKGFLIFKGTKIQSTVGNLSVNLIPFSFQLSNDNSHEVDIAYNYDLDSPEGKDAFHRAVLGSFVKSEEVANAELNHSNPSVTKIFQRTTNSNSKEGKLDFEFSLFFGKTLTAGRTSLKTELVLPDGTRQLMKSTAENTNDENILIESQETMRRISVMVDADGFRDSVPGSLVVVAENMIEDSSTKAKALNAYAKQVEDFFQNPKLFPVFPEDKPAVGDKRPKKMQYGRSSFYYGFTLEEKDIKLFLDADPALLTAEAKELGFKFNERAFLAARAALISRDSAKIYSSLTELFSNDTRTKALMGLVLANINTATPEKFLVAQNEAFGSVQNRGPQVSAIEKSLNETDKDMGIGSDVNRSVADPDAVISKLSTQLNSDKHVEIHFNLATVPQFLFFRMTPLTHPHAGDDAVELVIFNRDNRFTVGENVLVLDPASADPLIHKLTDHMEANEIVMLTLGYSNHNSLWGAGTETQFATGDAYTPASVAQSLVKKPAKKTFLDLFKKSAKN